MIYLGQNQRRRERERGRECERVLHKLLRGGPKAVALKYGQLNCQTVNFVLTSLKNFSAPSTMFVEGKGKGKGAALRKISI